MYVITNGNTYITKSRSGKVGKTSNILEAEWFDSIDIANIIFQHAPGKIKGSILPEDFRERVTEIFMYQTEKKTTHPLKWKIVHRLLQSCIK